MVRENATPCATLTLHSLNTTAVSRTNSITEKSETLCILLTSGKMIKVLASLNVKYFTSKHVKLVVILDVGYGVVEFLNKLRTAFADFV